MRIYSHGQSADSFGIQLTAAGHDAQTAIHSSSPLSFLLAHAAAQNSGSDSRGPDSTKDSGSVVTQGEVRVYEPGKFLDLDVRPMVGQKFDLTSTSPRYVVEDGTAFRI